MLKIALINFKSYFLFFTFFDFDFRIGTYEIKLNILLISNLLIELFFDK